MSAAQRSSERESLLESDSPGRGSPTPAEMARCDDPPVSTYLHLNAFRGVSAVVAQVGLVLTTTVILRVVKENPAGLFSYHPSLQALAVLGFVEGVLLLQPNPVNSSSKKKGIQLHQVFQYTALPLIIAGATFIVYNKAIKGANHFTTWHAKAGLVTLCLIATQILFGAFMLYAPLQRVLGGEGRAKKWWKYHRMSGYVTLVFLLATPTLALWSDWLVMNASQTERNLIGSGLVLTAVGLVTRIRTSKLGFKR
ncbi:hypothetical protein JCM10212_001144 [Sporobolomyces blumeae]